MDNDQALASGLQIGNQWAAQRERNRSSRVDEKYRADAQQDRLKEAFGEDTVFDKDGKVDILGSAGKKRARMEIDAQGAGKGFSEAQRAALPPEATPDRPPVPAFQVQPDATATPPQIQSPYQVIPPPPPSSPTFGRAPSTGMIPPPPMQQPDAPRFIPAQEPTRQVQPAPPVIPNAAPAPVAGPRPPVPSRIPDMTGWSAPQIAAFMHAYPVAKESERKTQTEIATEANRLAIRQLQNDAIEKQIAGAQRRTETTVEGKKDVQDIIGDQKREANEARLIAVDKQIQAKESLQKANIAAKQANAFGQMPKLVGAENVKVTEYAKSVATKELASDIIDDAVSTLEDPQIPYHVRYTTAQSLFKTLNSADYRSDAVNGEEADRIGRLLKLDLNPFHYYQSGRALPSMDAFLQQIKIKSADLKKQTAGLNARIDAVYSKHMPSPDSLSKPDKVPQVKWESMTPAQRAQAVQLFK